MMFRVGLLLLLAGVALQDDIEQDFRKNSRRAAKRDAFPVLNNPTLDTAEQAERSKAVRPDDPVIGIEINGEARAYPLVVMGTHELANDTCGGEPIAVSW